MRMENPAKPLTDQGSVGRYLQNILLSLPSSLAQLVFLSSLRDPYTGRYIHEGWATVSTPDEINMILRGAHESVFYSVIELPLVEICKELRTHFESLGQPELRVANFWLETEPYYEMIPAGSALLSRKFFVSQFRLALELLTSAPANWKHLDSCVVTPLATATAAAALPTRAQWLN